MKESTEVPPELRRVPPVLLECDPVLVAEGGSLWCRARSAGAVPPELKLALELVNNQGSRILSHEVM